MKKILTILILLVSITTISAADYISPTITLNGKVPTTAPEFKFYGSIYMDYTDAAEGGGIISGAGDPALSNIIAYFKLIQSNLARYKALSASLSQHPLSLQQ